MQKTPNSIRQPRKPQDMLSRIEADSGTRTLGELLQERQWALDEINRLRAKIEADLLDQKNKNPLEIKRNSASAAHGAPEALNFMRLADVQLRFGISRSTIYRLMQDGVFPRPIKFGSRLVRWRYCEVAAWMDSKCLT